MRPFLVCLGVGLALGVAIGSRAAASDNAYLAPVARAVRMAPRIEAWRLSCRDTSETVIHYGVAIDIGQVADLDSLARAKLATILREASRDTAACEEYRCDPCPAYRLIIHDREPAIRVVISQGCVGWSFTRGWDRLSNDASCYYLPARLVEPLRELLKRIYGPQFEN